MSGETRYLPVCIVAQDYLIGMDVVLAVQPIVGTEQTADETVPVVDLGILFGRSAPPPARQYAILVTTRTGTCALLVDAVRSIISAGQDKVQDLPHLLTLTRCPFAGILNEREKVFPVIDVTRLLERLRTVRPDLVTGVSNADG